MQPVSMISAKKNNALRFRRVKCWVDAPNRGTEAYSRGASPPVLPRGVVFFDEDDSSNYSCPTLEEELDTELPSRGAVLRRE